MKKSDTQHRWKFHRAGGVDQVTLRDGADLVHLGELDPKLWVALAMPTRGVHLDPKTLAALDTDGDGRIRLPEVLDAVKWATASLRSPDELLRGGDRLALDAIADPELLASAKRILDNLGKGAQSEISVEDVADTNRIFAETRFNGDGVVPVESADGDDARRLVTDIIETHGSVPDRSGKPGVNGEKADAFFAEVEALAAWATQGRTRACSRSAPRRRPRPMPRWPCATRSTTTSPAAASPPSIARAAAALSGSDEELAALSRKDLSQPGEVAALPLSRIEAGRALPLDGGVNPAWADALHGFAAAAVAPLVGGGRASLCFAEWGALKGRLAPYEAWRAEKPKTAVEKLGIDRVRALAGGAAKAVLADLIARRIWPSPPRRRRSPPSRSCSCASATCLSC